MGGSNRSEFDHSSLLMRFDSLWLIISGWQHRFEFMHLSFELLGEWWYLQL
jgi:hypothetical protein